MEIQDSCRWSFASRNKNDENIFNLEIVQPNLKEKMTSTFEENDPSKKDKEEINLKNENITI